MPGDIAAVAKVDEITFDCRAARLARRGPHPPEAAAISGADARRWRSSRSAAATSSGSPKCCTSWSPKTRASASSTTRTNETVIRGLGDLHLRYDPRAHAASSTASRSRRGRRASPTARPSRRAPKAITATRSRPAAPASSAKCSCASSRSPRGARLRVRRPGQGRHDPVRSSSRRWRKACAQVLTHGRGRRLPDAGRARDRLRRQAPPGRLQGSRVRRGRQARRSSTRSARRGRIVLEPIVNVEINAPASEHGRHHRRHLAPSAARSAAPTARRRGMVTISGRRCRCPNSTSYQARLKSVTAGQGSFVMEFSHYEPVPADRPAAPRLAIPARRRRSITPPISSQALQG